MPLKGVALIRVSTAGQADESKGGIPAQREAVRRIASQHQIEISSENYFELTDISGASVLLSADYRRFLKAVEHPAITAVVTKEFTRLMRPERFDDYAILQHFVDNGITLYMPDAVMNLANNQDRFFAGLKAGMAGMERNEIRQRMMDGKEALRRKGMHPSAGHTLARGICYSKERAWYYDEQHLAPVRLLFNLFLKGEHNYARLAQLTGISRSSIRIILTNPIYAGVMMYRTKNDLSAQGMYPRKEGKRAYRRKVQRSAEERIEVKTNLDPLITMDQQRFIVDVIENARAPRAHAREQAQPRFAYRGFLRCGCCGDLMYTWVGGRLLNGQPKDFYYCKSMNARELAKRRALSLERKCQNRNMSRGRLETTIDTVLAERLSAKEFLYSVIHVHLERMKSSQRKDEAIQFEQQIQRLEAKRNRITEAFIDGNIDRVSTNLRLSDIDNQVDQLRLQVGLANTSVHFGPEEITQIVRVFRKWRFRRMSEKRAILERLVSQIYVDRYEVQGVSLRLPSSHTDNHRPTADIVTTSLKPSFTEIFIPFVSKEVAYEAAHLPSD